MTFLLFAPASTKWLGWRKTQKIPKEQLSVGRFSDMNCAVILRYSFALRVISDILWSNFYESHGPKLKTLVKRRWSYKVRTTVYILTLSEFARHEFTNLWLETFSWTLPDTLSLSLTGIRLGPKQARRANDSTASLSLAERWTITEIRRPSNSVLTYSVLTDVLPL